MKRELGLTLTLAAAAVMTAGMLGGCGKASSGQGGREEVRLMVWSPSEDQSKDSGQWLQTSCEQFAKQHPEWDITFVYGVADEATAANQVAQDAEASADVFMYANDTLTIMTDAGALVKFGGKYREEIESTNSKEVIDSVTMDGELYGVPFTTNTWFMYYDKSVFSEEDIKNLDQMLTKGVVSFPFTNSWYLPSFYIGNGCSLFGDGTDESQGVDFGGEKALEVTNYLVDLIANPNFRVDADGRSPGRKHTGHFLRLLGYGVGERDPRGQHGRVGPSCLYVKRRRAADDGVCRFQGDRSESGVVQYGPCGPACCVLRLCGGTEASL